jgi:lipoprotein-anchoring transpeptidase ErfK/SrfK
VSATLDGQPATAGRARRLLLAGLGLVAVLAIAAAAGVVEDEAHAHRLAPGVSIGGIDVGGLSATAARERLRRRAVEPRRRTLHVLAGTRTFALSPAQARASVDVDAALRRALADSRRGWLGVRVVHDLTGRRVDEDVPLRVDVASGAVARLVAQVADAVRRRPVDASVRPSAGGLAEVRSRPGRRLQARDLLHRLTAALIVPTLPAEIVARTAAVAPRVSTAKLAAKYPAYIVVDRKAHVLRFFQHLRLTHTWPIAVGMQGLETPVGLYDVQWKQTNPSWYVPNSPWAGKLAGKVIPPGPDDPIKARWMAFNGGAGIHGIDPSEYGTIGHDASHGCVRMRIPDVISLYARTPVGTPVYVA